MNQKKMYQKRSLIESLSATGIWFLLTLFIALPQGLKTPLSIGGLQIPHNASPQLIRSAWGPGDAGSLLDTAITWSRFHQIDRVTQFWVVHLWTPGMSMIEVPLIWIAKLGIPIFWSLLLLTLTTWSTIFWFTWRFVSPIIGRNLLTAFAAVLLSSWDFRYIFKDDFFYTEGLAFGFLLLGLGFISWEYLMMSGQKSLYVVGGLLIGFSIMIRYVSDIGLLLLFTIASSLLLLEYRKARSPVPQQNGMKQKRSLSKLQFTKITTLKAFGVWLSCAVALAFTIPWRFASFFIFDGPFLSLSSASGLVGQEIWMPNSRLGIWKLSGMNWGCVIDPAKCNAINHTGTTIGTNTSLLLNGITSAFRHPIAFLETRWHFFTFQWIPRNGTSGYLYILQNIMSVIPIVLFLVGLVLFVRDRSAFRAAWIWVPFLLAEIAQLLVIHYESRYFMPVRFFALGFFVFTLLEKKTRLTNDGT